MIISLTLITGEPLPPVGSQPDNPVWMRALRSKAMQDGTSYNNAKRRQRIVDKHMSRINDLQDSLRQPIGFGVGGHSSAYRDRERNRYEVNLNAP